MLGLAFPLALFATAGTVLAQESGARDETLEDSLSIGHTEDGRLEHPFAVESGDYLASVRPNRFGTRELVGLLERAAATVARVAPGARLAVGDLSSETGGHLTPHESHQSGRDADVAFYVLDANGQPVPQAIFIDIGEDGAGRRGSTHYRFDVARNWALLVAFVDDPMAETQYVLVASHLRAMLLDHARTTAVPEDQVRRVEVVTAPIRGSERHDDHFHVRIYCSVGDRPQCLDRPPLHPWYCGTPSPDAVAAARVADIQRAAALRRQQEIARQGEAELARGQAREEALETARARDLANEPTRQERLEQLRALALTRDERRALADLRRIEVETRREQDRARTAEHGRAAVLVAEERRWTAAERRRADRLRASLRQVEADDRRRAAAAVVSGRRAAELARRTARDAERRAAALERRSAAQQAEDRRRAAQLLQQSESLGRERARPR